MKPDSADLHLERLSAEDAPELQRALGAARQRLPDPQQLAALAAQLSALGLPVKPPAAPVPTTTPWRLWLAAGVVGPGLIALLLWWSEAPRPNAAAVVARPSASTAALASAPSFPSASGSGVSPRTPLAAPLSAVPPDPEAERLPPAAPSANAAAEPKSVPSLPAPSRRAAPLDRAPSSEGSAAHPGASERASAVTGGGTVAPPTELALLRDAQLALRTNPAQALAMTEQHQALFSHGAMVQERELIAISALARLGRRSAVLARAAQFAHDFPSSPYGKQIEALAR